MRAFLVKAIPVIAIILFVSVMISDNFLKKPMGADDDIPGSIKLVIADINSDNWEEAGRRTEQLAAAWKKVVKRVQYSAEMDELEFFDINIARIRGAIMSRDKNNAVIELNEAYEHWENIGG